MKYIKIKAQKIPAVGLGTWELSGSQCTKCVLNAFDIGYRHIDTAQIYNNEKRIGDAIRKSGLKRSEIFLVTKIATSNFKYEDALQSSIKSIDELQTDYVDLLLLHWPNNSVPLDETLDAACELQEAGRVKNLGLSNFPPSLVEKASERIDVFCNQIEYHPYISQEELLSHSKKMGYLITAYCPIAKGRIMKDSTIGELSDRYGKTPAQITLRWLYQQGVASIPKSSSVEHLKENIDIFDFKLNRNDMNLIYSQAIDLHLDPVSYLANEGS